MLLFPVTLAYVIVVHRAMDVRVVLRQGLQYTLATRGIRVVQIILIAILISVAVNFMNRPDVSNAHKLTIISLFFAAVFSLRRIALKARAWTDRRFFRDAYNSEQILSSLSNDRRFWRIQPLLKHVRRKSRSRYTCRGLRCSFPKAVSTALRMRLATTPFLKPNFPIQQPRLSGCARSRTCARVHGRRKILGEHASVKGRAAMSGGAWPAIAFAAFS